MRPTEAHFGREAYMSNLLSNNTITLTNSVIELIDRQDNVSVVQAISYLVDQTCDVSTDNGNSLPVITPQPNILSYSIPIGTPFYLEATATDADEDDSLTYLWEQNDDGVVTSDNFGPNNASGAAFRSVLPSSDGNRRYFPRLSSVLAPPIKPMIINLPSIPRTSKFLSK